MPWSKRRESNGHVKQKDLTEISGRSEVVGEGFFEGATFKSRPEHTQIRPIRGELETESQVEGRARAKALRGAPGLGGPKGQMSVHVWR